MGLIVISLFAIFDVIFWIALDRRLRPLRRSPLWRRVLAVFVGLMLLYLGCNVFFGRHVRRSQAPIPTVVHATVYLWHFLVLPWVIIALGLLRVWRLKRFLRPRRVTAIDAASSSPTASSIEPGDMPRRAPTRRQLLSAAAFAAPPIIAIGGAFAAVRTLYGRRLRSFDLMIPQLPPQLNGMTIAHVSDIHIGSFFNPDRLPSIADDINRLDADFVAFTGDLIDLSLDDLRFGVDFLRRLKPRCGMVICEGNHDLMDHNGSFRDLMRDTGLPFIVNEQLTIPYNTREGAGYPVQFLATPWTQTDPEMVYSVRSVGRLVNQDAFPILLAHHPHSFDSIPGAGIPLVLSGHTHGGQIMIDDQHGLGKLRFRYTSGLYQNYGSSLIVNNGLGAWFPLRINAPAEIIHITLRSIS